jgi:hypothetical protein
VANSTWGSFRQLNGNWWFFVKGKGGKLGHVPVNDQLLSMIKIYRLSLRKNPLPELDELESVLISQKTKKPLSIRQLFGDVKSIGKLAALKFQDPLKRQKLESLSPHWLRHLSASHQDLVGISSTMIQANHRHGSFATTQIYLHAPDALRAQEMQRMKIAIYPKLYAEKSDGRGTQIKLSLIGSSLAGVDGLQRLIGSIKNVLADFKCSRSEDLQDLLKRYEEIKDFKKPIEIVYSIATEISSDGLKYLKTAIMREAEIRLFQCNMMISNV